MMKLRLIEQVCGCSTVQERWTQGACSSLFMSLSLCSCNRLHVHVAVFMFIFMFMNKMKTVTCT